MNDFFCLKVDIHTILVAILFNGCFLAYLKFAQSF